MIAYLYYILFFLTPLLFSQKTSELFEFNKIVLIYLSSILILIIWILNMLKQRKFIYRHTILEKPLLIFLATQAVSTVLSLDRHTSLLGYYSRFNGGLASSLAYTILYFSFVTFMNKETTKKAIYLLLASAFIVSVWGILEHFGYSFSCLLLRQSFNVDCWVQDVQNRIFATLGQPNWLAAFLSALIPLAWSIRMFDKRSKKGPRKYIWISLSGVSYSAFLFTKSRSGILGFLVAFIIYWGLSYFTKPKHSKDSIIKPFLITSSILLVLTFLIVPWTSKEIPSSQTALETGGTESGDIRKIVWKGAVDAWSHYPIFGTGVETFSIAYNQFKPKEHNLTSEWDFNYNRAHNEYLNYLVTSGILGLMAYLILIIFTIIQVYRSKFRAPLLAGYVSILITNFFGFSVTTTSLLFFLFPALAACLSSSDTKSKISNGFLKLPQLLALSAVLIICIFLLIATCLYWYGDTIYTAGKIAIINQDYKTASEKLTEAASISPNESAYWIALAESDVNLALVNESIDITKRGVSEMEKASDLSPKNINIRKTKYSLYTSLSQTDPSYLFKARGELLAATTLAPNDAKLYYLLGQVSWRVKLSQEAISALEYAISLKPDYDKARDLLTLIQKN